MEFYGSFSAKIHKAKASFNSQRDGILQTTQEQKGNIYKEFQFPTGWNSTCLILPPSRNLAGFNSQRDGILLSYRMNQNDMIKFQFPTGWNSTQKIFEKRFVLNEFQFPTGWNSTKIRL